MNVMTHHMCAPNPPKFTVGSVVMIPEPTHHQWYNTHNVIGFVYESYVHNGRHVYVILCKKFLDLYDMKHMSPSTAGLSDGICCQHLDEDRIQPLPELHS